MHFRAQYESQKKLASGQQHSVIYTSLLYHTQVVLNTSTTPCTFDLYILFYLLHMAVTIDWPNRYVYVCTLYDGPCGLEQEGCERRHDLLWPVLLWHMTSSFYGLQFHHSRIAFLELLGYRERQVLVRLPPCKQYWFFPAVG